MKFKLTLWRVIFIVIMALGLYSSFVRYFRGLGVVSNMTDQFPWGLWIGFDCLCGVMLAAGGFCMVGAVYLFNVERLHAVVRPAVLTAFLGYLLFIVGLLFDLGRPWFIWHQMIYMNPHSVMFEVGFCVMTYTTVLFFEFLPNVLERFNLQTPIKWIKKIYPVLIVGGILLSTLHQSSLGSLYLIMPSKLHPFWYSPALPFFFFASAVAVGLAMTIFESTQSAKAFGRQLELPVLVTLGGALLIALWVNALLRFEDFFHRGLLRQVVTPSYEAYFLWLELTLTFVIPITMLSFKKVRLSPQLLYLASISTVLGFITNRLNIALIGFETYVGHHYMPKWTEFSITLMIIAMGFALFGVAVRYLPIFGEEEKHVVQPRIRSTRRHRCWAMLETEKKPAMGMLDRVRYGLGTKLIVMLLGAMLVIFALLGYLTIRLQRQHLEAATLLSAERISDVIRRNTTDYMLRNDREGLHHTISTMASEPGVMRVRIFDREGHISYSTDPSEINRTVDKDAEACYGCHAHQQPLTSSTAPTASASTAAEGQRVLAIITPIENQPDCSNAACHAHPASQQILGVLDTHLSLARTDQQLAQGSWRMLACDALAMAAIAVLSWLFIRRVVDRPLKQLQAGTQKLSEGAWATRSTCTPRIRLETLADSFNS